MKLSAKRLIGFACVILALAVGVPGCDWPLSGKAHTDPRSYPGGVGDRSLDQILAYNYLKLPRCAVKTVRYLDHSRDAFQSVLYAHWSGSRSCFDEFLTANGMDQLKPIGTTVSGKKFDPLHDLDHGPPFVPPSNLKWFKKVGAHFLVYEKYVPSPDMPHSSDVVVGVKSGRIAQVYIRCINNR